jgi:hypothetical protein
MSARVWMDVFASEWLTLAIVDNDRLNFAPLPIAYQSPETSCNWLR